jgi:HSP20 family protein
MTRKEMSPWRWGGLKRWDDEIEDEKAIHIRVELPGMDKDDVDITLSEGMLTIAGEKKPRSRLLSKRAS